jgi:hypothetical protein
MKKSIIGIFAATVILLSFLGPLLYAPVQADVPADYSGKTGVLSSDYYSLYPFEDNDLTIGFSKYGEMINPYTGHGLNYSSRDPFANEGIPKQFWLQGWVVDIRYVHRAYGARHIWAMATFADLTSSGGAWINGATDPYGTPYGGRKTSGSAASDAITILYDGPRLFVAVVRTHINDTRQGSTWPVLDVMFTIIFEKDMKQVIVLKDIKLMLPAKILVGPVDVLFSNRGEWDLGPASLDFKSYAHFWHQSFYTSYGADWHLEKNITREYHYLNTAFMGNSLNLITGVSPQLPYGAPVVEGSEYVFVNGQWIGINKGGNYTIDYNTGIITFATSWPSGTKVEVYFKLYKHEVDKNELGPIMGLPQQYDLAQIISADNYVVGYAAFWPVLSDYTPNGWSRALVALNVANEADLPIEPDIPYVIGQWDFMLDPLVVPQFRGVTVYGIVNWHDADDADMGVGHDNIVDIEAQYQLDAVFNSWGLTQAVEKDTSRWVQFYTVKSTDVGHDLYIWLETPDGDLNWPILKAPVWEQYGSFSEKVLWGSPETLKYPLRSVYTSYNYELYLDGEEGYIYIPASKVPAAGTQIKILYSTTTDTIGYPGRYEWGIVGRDAASVDSAGLSMVSAAFKDKKVEYGLAGEDIWNPITTLQMPSVMAKFGAGDTRNDYKDALGRAALKDDFCTTYPIASSNMIGEGGPNANMLAYYGNDFEDAYFDATTGKIVSLTCWSKDTYASSATTGYAVISTYLDLNGTVLFLVWGYDGRDTYQASKRFMEDIIYELQDLSFHDATALVLKIDYTKHIPKVSVIEVLGTISERAVTDVSGTKGGIHPDP